MKGNVLKISALKKGSEWCDKDRVMLYVCFQLLVDFIEKEKPQKIVDYDYDAYHRKQWKELQILYKYWKVDRPRLQKEEQKALRKWAKTYKDTWVAEPDGRSSLHVVLHEDKRASVYHWKLEDRIRTTDDEMLHRLIDIRHHLWC